MQLADLNKKNISDLDDHNGHFRLLCRFGEFITCGDWLPYGHVLSHALDQCEGIGPENVRVEQQSDGIQFGFERTSIPGDFDCDLGRYDGPDKWVPTGPR